jgi:hypothetical protein
MEDALKFQYSFRCNHKSLLFLLQVSEFAYTKRNDLPGETRFGRSAVNKSAYAEIIERMYSEMQEYMMNIPLNVSGSDIILALFFCSNIPTVDSIVTRVKSYGGVQGVELFIITRMTYHQEWLVREINKKSRIQKQQQLESLLLNSIVYIKS